MRAAPGEAAGLLRRRLRRVKHALGPLAALVALGLLGAAATGAPAAPSPAAREEELARLRNLGKAFYENPTTQYQAVEVMKKALDLAPDSSRERLNYGLALLRAGKLAEGMAELAAVQKQDPALPHTWWNLGIAYKRESHHEEAIAQLEGFLARVPDEPAAHYNLGVLYKLAGKPELALRHLEEAARLAPDMAAPRFQLYNAYRQVGRGDDERRELARFQEIKQRQAGAAVPEDPEWSWYSEVYDPVAAEALADHPAELAFTPREVATGVEGESAGLAVLDADGDLRPDLLAWSLKGVLLFRSGTDAVTPSGLEALAKAGGPLAFVPGDLDNDGLMDLAVLAAGQARLFANRGGRFEELSGRLPVAASAAKPSAAVWLDYDHDYDLDLLLVGEGAALARNNGDDTWADETAHFPFLPGKALSAVSLDVVSDSQGIDVAVAYADRPGVLYRDRLGGRYEAEPLPELPANARALAAGDWDGDGWTDLAAATPAGPFLLRNRRQDRGITGIWEPLAVPAPATTRTGTPFLLADLENRGVLDLVAGGTAFRGAGRGAFAAAGKTMGPAAPSALTALAAADFDADGRLDLAAIDGGILGLLANRTETANRWLRVALAGVKNLKLAQGAEVEVKAGAGYQKKLYVGIPLLFGLGGRDSADTVRITWPNGLIQNETKQPAATAAGAGAPYKEAQRLSGSCPMIFTWDGERFRFLTDVLGVAPLGASAGNGEYFPVDNDEYVQIPGEALVPVDGRYLIHVTEELREVSYLDKLELIAVDHPAEAEIFTNDKFKGPPFPEFRLFGVRRRLYPLRALDARGHDVRERLLARDGRYPDGFARDYAGVAETHHLDLDFGAAAPDGRAVLILSGWVDWADGSTFLGAAQSRGLLMPQLQVQDAAGQWRTVIEDMGIPAGKPKTIAVDLTGKFLSPARRVRIVTNLCVYWDEIFLSTETGEPRVRLSPLAPVAAELGFRGFSTPTLHPERKQPESFDYQRLLPPERWQWNPTPGLYTRYGDVRPLLAQVDDRLALLGSGDEVRLAFDAAALPPLPVGWRRDFLLGVDGWAKDADANTAFSQSVEPLPFHGMSRYPYPDSERFPDDREHALYQETYNTRPALRLLRPLAGTGEERP